MFEGTRSLINLMGGIILLAMGGIALLHSLGIIGFGIPELPKTLLQVLLGVIGIYLIIDGVMVITMHPVLTLLDIVLGLVTAALGLLPLMHSLTGIMLPIPLNAAIVNIIFLVTGIILIINSWNF